MFPTPYAIGDETENGKKHPQRFGPETAQSYDNYHVVVTGPAGPRCDRKRRFGVGYLTEERRRPERTVTVRPPFPRNDPRWCPGHHLGTVSYYQPDRNPGIPPERLGKFSFSPRR